MQKIKYSAESSSRLDKYLSQKYPFRSRRFWQKAIKAGQVVVNQEKKKPRYQLNPGDSIELRLDLTPPPAVSSLSPQPKITVPTIASYPDFLIVWKPAGLVTHPGRFEVENNSAPPSLAAGLLAIYPELQTVGEDPLRPAVVHRLDKDTSGLMIIPRHQKAFTEFKKMFQKRLITKTYLALSWKLGQFNRRSTLNKKYRLIDTPIGKSSQDHTKQATAKNPNKLINPKEAATYFKIIAEDKLPCPHRVGPKINSKLKKFRPTALIQIQPKTGRKHQIRVHLHSIGLPLVGDKIYTSRLVKNCNRPFPHHLLEAHQLEFTYQGQSFSFRSPLPAWANFSKK